LSGYTFLQDMTDPW